MRCADPESTPQPMSLPHYYTSLKPFREVFAAGTPVLTYHHVGVRPRGVRIKGLFVAPKLFSRQMEELAKKEFSAPHLDNVLSHAKRENKSVNMHKEREVWITFDDGFVDVFDNALSILQKHRFSSIQFLVADLLGKTNQWQERAGDVSQPLMDIAQVREWLAAGQEIGSHTCAHPKLTQLPTAQAREEIVSSKKKLEDTFGRAIRHFCYPYGDWDRAVRDLVEEAGYESACTTQAGVNVADYDLFALKRFTARYRSRTLRNFFPWWS
jgi:peptidoglycan/xylan/chitin deacetylase (PgdA/CDA1 family)